MKKRIYTVKDVELIIVAATIIENAISNKQFLQSKRTTWTDEFFQNFKDQIDAVAQNHLGADSAKNLRKASAIVLNMQKSALANLTELKTQIIQDFKKTPVRRQEILDTLGFTTYYKPANDNRDQEALVELLYHFKTNLAAEIKTEIIEKGTLEQTINAILTYADTLKNADIQQETSKGTRKTMTQEGVNAFNEIYEDIIAVCQISRKFYKGDPAKQDMFSFAKIARTLNGK